jgi:hypothetical protein
VSMTFFKKQFCLVCCLAGLVFTKPVSVLAQCCTYTISTNDSYGDGWNGGYLQVYVNGDIIGTFYATDYGSIDSFQICTNDILTVNYVPLEWEEENTYQIRDASFNVILAQGPNPLSDTTFTLTGNCNTLPAPGINPCTAIELDTNQCIVTDNLGVTGTALNPGCANYVGGDIWFKIQVPPSGNIYFNTNNGDLNDTGIAAWQGDNCLGLSPLSCDDDGGDGYYSMLTLFDLEPLSTLYIQVFGYGGASGTFELCSHNLGIVTVDSTELPLILINTLGQTIVPDTKIEASMQIKYNGLGAFTHLTDSANVYNGNIGIEIRGATSAGYPQAPYNIETHTSTGADNNVSLLNMPAESDWVLLSNFNDRSLIRNSLAFNLFEKMGNYSTRSRLCEVLVDSSYKGIYLFGEKIKRDANRVDISKLYTYENSGDDLTGGYILQQNYWDANNSFQSNFPPIDHPSFDVHFLYEYPKLDSITPTQKTYIASFIDSLETALYSSDFTNQTSGYRKYLDVNSFIDYFLVNELSRNNDGFKKSVFFYKDKFSNGGKLKAGPVWDFDWAWKNLATCSIFEATDGSGWAHLINDCPTDNYSTGWYVRLLQDSTFANDLKCRYIQFRESFMSNASINHYIDSVGTLVQNAQERHFSKWPLLGQTGPAPEIGVMPTTYTAELDTLKHWISKRLAWLDENMPGTCPPIFVSTGEEISADVYNYYPNPSSGQFKFVGISKSGHQLSFSVYNISGKCIDNIQLDTHKQNFCYTINK